MDNSTMEDPIGDGKLVELTYKVIDAKTNSVLTEVEFPIGYVPVSYTHLTLPTKA